MKRPYIHIHFQKRSLRRLQSNELGFANLNFGRVSPTPPAGDQSGPGGDVMAGSSGFIVRYGSRDDRGEVASAKFWNLRAGTDEGRSSPPGIGVPEPVTGAGVDAKTGPRDVRGRGDADIFVLS